MSVSSISGQDYPPAPGPHGIPDNWKAVIFGCVAIFACCSFQYTFGVFVKPFIDSFGWSRAAIAGAVSLRAGVGGVISPFIGAVYNRLGASKLIFTGVVLVGLSYVLTSTVTSLWELYAYVGVLTGAGLALVLVPVMTIISHSFGRRSAIPNGIALGGMSLAQVVLPPLTTFLILRFDLQVCFLVLGFVAWGLGALAWGSLRKLPVTAPLSHRLSQGTKPGISSQGPQQPEFSFREALHTRSIWILLGIQFTLAVCYEMVVIHVVVAAIDVGITAEAAALILTLSGVGNTVGRIAVTVVANRIGLRTILALSLAVQAFMLFVLTGAHDLGTFCLVSTVIGLMYAGVTPIVVTLAGNLFGQKAMGSIIGTVNASYNTGIAFGPLIAGLVFDASGSYAVAFSSAGLAMALVFILSLAIKAPQKQRVLPA